MEFAGGTAYAESDADDEYERGHSPINDSEHSPIDSELSTSAEHTPTTYDTARAPIAFPRQSSPSGRRRSVPTSSQASGCSNMPTALSVRFVDNTGERDCWRGSGGAHHDDLKSMGITSVGHRLSILKSVYDVKKAQDVAMESDHYMPLSADAEAQYATATIKDIKHLVEQLRLRDERMNLLEQDLRRTAEDFRRLREECSLLFD
ncbi:unnamed protein product [Clonostachys rosea f. rosea IK726]|uniref:Uncharacterized protein n=1 Tax=Clonostachys rosea f. rosea IK726 TaxID=1349383 RepID=A0ACA9U9S6_BIOOC|nr:unnamed protein product [Clonostachys rosea f. rosea IK726]